MHIADDSDAWTGIVQNYLSPQLKHNMIFIVFLHVTEYPTYSDHDGFVAIKLTPGAKDDLFFGKDDIKKGVKYYIGVKPLVVGEF